MRYNITEKGDIMLELIDIEYKIKGKTILNKINF